MDLNSVIGNNSLKFHDETMMGLEHSEKDGTEGQAVAAKNDLAGNELRCLPESEHYYSPVPLEIMQCIFPDHTVFVPNTRGLSLILMTQVAHA